MMTVAPLLRASSATPLSRWCRHQRGPDPRRSYFQPAPVYQLPTLWNELQKHWCHRRPALADCDVHDWLIASLDLQGGVRLPPCYASKLLQRYAESLVTLQPVDQRKHIVVISLTIVDEVHALPVARRGIDRVVRTLHQQDPLLGMFSGKPHEFDGIPVSLPCLRIRDD